MSNWWQPLMLVMCGVGGGPPAVTTKYNSLLLMESELVAKAATPPPLTITGDGAVPATDPTLPAVALEIIL